MHLNIPDLAVSAVGFSAISGEQGSFLSCFFSFLPLVLFGSQGGPSIIAVCRGGQHSLGQCVVCLKAEAEADPAERSSCMPETQDAKLTFLFPAIPLRGSANANVQLQPQAE